MSTTHIFIINNGISESVTRSIIDEENLYKEKIILLLYRNTSTNILSKAVTILRTADLQIKYSTIPFSRKTNERIQQVKDLLNTAILNKVDNYILYVSTFIPFAAITLLNHEKCKYHNIMEEGGSAMYTKEERYARLKKTLFSKTQLYFLKQSLHHRFAFFNNHKNIQSYFDKARCYYALSDKAYPDLPNTIRLRRTNITTDKAKKSSLYILAFTYIVEAKLITLNNYIASLKRVFRIIEKSNIDHLLIKYHPQQFISSKYITRYDLLIQSELNHTTYEFLNASTSLEQLSEQHNVHFISSISSILMFALENGHPISSYYNILCNTDPNFASNLLPNKMKSILLENKISEDHNFNMIG